MAFSQAEAQQEVLICQALPSNDIHVGVEHLQPVCVGRQLLWYICDAGTSAIDGAFKIAVAAAGANRVAFQVWQCEEDEYHQQGACAVEMNIN